MKAGMWNHFWKHFFSPLSIRVRKSFSFHLTLPGRIYTDVSHEPHLFLTSRHNRYKQSLGDELAQSLPEGVCISVDDNLASCMLKKISFYSWTVIPRR